MELVLSEKVKQKLKEFVARDAKLANKIYKQLDIFMVNPRHPGLRLHKLTGSLGDSWSISAGPNFRLVYTLTPSGKAYFYKLGTHDEVYRK